MRHPTIVFLTLSLAGGCALPPPPPPIAEFLVSAGDQTYWVRSDNSGLRIRGSPLILARTGGKELVDITILNGATVTWTDATTKQRSAAMPVTAFITADAAGHVYAWTVDPASRQLVISVLEPGKVASTLPHDGTVTLWPDPRGTRVAELGSNQVALYKLDGTLVWKQSVMNANKVLWPSDDSLAVISATGIARLDAATGAVTGARCGWSFGLRPTAHTASVRMEPLCTQLGP